MLPFEDESCLVSVLQSPLDYIRYGLTQAQNQGLWYGHGTDNAFDEMHSLILTSLGLPLDVDTTLLQTCLTIEERSFLVSQLKKRLIDKVPVPYLTKQAYFCGEPYYVDERVLIPRSPIAELIEVGFHPWISEHPVSQVLDLCTGSGCIAIACAKAFPEAMIDAVDISSEALEVAKINIKRHGVEEQVQCIQSDVFDQIPLKRYDLIVSNPPYVGAEEMLTLPTEYRHEPKLALETEDNGLLIVRRILQKAANYLAETGILVVEVGNSAQALMQAYPLVPFVWLDFERGGDGVFLLTASDLRRIT